MENELRNKPDILTRLLYAITFTYFSYSFMLSFFHYGKLIRVNLLIGMVIAIAFMVVKLARHEKFRLALSTLAVILILIIWISYALVSVLWAIDKDKAFLNGFFYFGYLAFILLSVLLIDRKKYAWRLLYVLNFVLVVYIIIACWEMITFNHLPYSSVLQLDTYPFVPNGPFFNVNDFASAIMLLTPFMYVLVKAKNNRIINILAFIVSILVFVTMLLEGARLSLIVFLGEALIFYVFFVNWKSKIVIAAWIAIIVIGLIHMYPREFRFASSFLRKEFTSIAQESDSYQLESIQARVNLMKHALEITDEAHYMGIGPGNFHRRMRSDRMLDTNHITITHNYFLEKLATDGIGAFLFLIALVGYLIIGNFYYAIKIKTRDRWLYMGYGSGIVMFFVAASIPSSINNHFFYWVVLGGALALLNITHVQQAENTSSSSESATN